MSKAIKLAVLVSGRGSNLQAIIDRIADKTLQAQIAVVITDKPDAYALTRAKELNIATVVVDRKQFQLAADFETALIESIKKYAVDLVVLAGFLRVLSARFIQHFSNRLINIHPSLLPAFPGLQAQRQALVYGVKYAGCTVHFVTEEVDGGPIILQAVVPVYDDDTEQSLGERILQEEHRILVKAIDLYSRHLLVIEQRRVRVIEEAL